MAKTPVMLPFCFPPSHAPRSCTKKSLILSMITITTADAPRQQLTRKCERCSSACCQEILSLLYPTFSAGNSHLESAPLPAIPCLFLGRMQFFLEGTGSPRSPERPT